MLVVADVFAILNLVMGRLDSDYGERLELFVTVVARPERGENRSGHDLSIMELLKRSANFRMIVLIHDFYFLKVGRIGRLWQLKLRRRLCSPFCKDLSTIFSRIYASAGHQRLVLP